MRPVGVQVKFQLDLCPLADATGTCQMCWEMLGDAGRCWEVVGSGWTGVGWADIRTGNPHAATTSRDMEGMSVGASLQLSHPAASTSV
nr:hypothetical protein CFP56_77853 [Quercus suber]